MVLPKPVPPAGVAVAVGAVVVALEPPQPWAMNRIVAATVARAATAAMPVRGDPWGFGEGRIF